ncbi:MAG: hypothetical protein H0V54_01895 [Chthoniobacterales bacterium]|nr:hypothetical protein [Chthoniobacterales bacterium]
MRILPRVLLLLMIPSLTFCEPLKTLRGRPLNCELDIPASWKIATDEGYKIIATGDGLGIQLGSLQQNLGDPSATLQTAKQMAAKGDPNAQIGEPTPITIDGRKWLQFTVMTGSGTDALKYLTYTYSGSEGTYVIEGCAMANQFEAKRALLARYMNTFRFPKKVAH